MGIAGLLIILGIIVWFLISSTIGVVLLAIGLAFLVFELFASRGGGGPRWWV